MSFEEKVEKARPTLEWLQKIVRAELSAAPQIVDVVHSVKSRVKSLDHLLEKIERKQKEGRNITPDNLFSEITDLVGVRVLILFPQDFKKIHGFITYMTSSKKWKLVGEPLAHVWDDDFRKFFENIGIKTTDTKKSKKTLYTSVHYIIKIDNTSPMRLYGGLVFIKPHFSIFHVYTTFSFSISLTLESLPFYIK